jgi:hypothetical protein
MAKQITATQGENLTHSSPLSEERMEGNNEIQSIGVRTQKRPRN